MAGPDPKVAGMLPCGCAPPPCTAESVRLHIEDPCLRKMVEADLAGEEPVFPLCPDPGCSHHGATDADGFRTGWAWSGSYQLLTVRLRKEAVRRLRGERAAERAAERKGPASGRKGNRAPRHDAAFRARVAGARARGESWAAIAAAHGVSRQAAQKWKDWPEVQAAEMVKGRPRGKGLHRPQRLGQHDGEVRDPRSRDPREKRRSSESE